MKDRISGYYWCRIKDNWIIAEWKESASKKYYWYLICNRNEFTDSYFNDINENKITKKMII